MLDAHSLGCDLVPDAGRGVLLCTRVTEAVGDDGRRLLVVAAVRRLRCHGGAEEDDCRAHGPDPGQYVLVDPLRNFF